MSDSNNGWTNWETWNSNLWFENFDEPAQETFDGLDFSLEEIEIKEKFTELMADYIESNIVESMDDFVGKNAPSLFTDFLQNSIQKVNFTEISSHYWDVVDKSKLEEFKLEGIENDN